ncbi:MAG: NAD(P)/FAD-dependent oxidoreductase [Giesbergeria sp.]
MQTNYDAIIVGAGPAGATAAILLARAGWSVALIEKQNFPRRKVCGECIAASNLPLLQAIGIDIVGLEAIAGPPLRRFEVLQGARRFTFGLPAAQPAGMEWGRALGRETLDTLLIGVARDAGVAVWQPWAVDSLDGAPGAFQCALRNTETSESAVFQAPVAILANGSWEPLAAQRAERRAQRRPSDLLAFKANFLGGTLPAGVLPVLSFPGGYGGMVRADAGGMTVACCVRADRLERLRRAAPGLSAGEVVQAMLRRECRGVEEALKTAVRAQPWLASGPLHPGVHLRDGDSIFRIGNAAAEAHPIIGEGMSMAMQSAWLLCSQLLDGVSQPPSALHQEPGADEYALWHAHVARQYARLWRRQFALRLRMAAVLAHAAMHPRLLSPMLRLAQHWPSALTRGVEWCGKTRTVPDAATIARLSQYANAHGDMTDSCGGSVLGRSAPSVS